MMSDNTPGSCCSPAAQRELGHPHVGTSFAPSSDDAHRAMVALSAGTLLMGTDYDRGFPADGEGPVRSVSLPAFNIDTYPVTNADFAWPMVKG